MSNIENFSSANDVLTDEQLQAGGLTKINAYVRSTPSKNAVRLKKQKDKAAENGIKQLNIQVPISMHETMKQIANHAQTDEKLKEILVWFVEHPMLPGFLASSTKRELILAVKNGREVGSMSGWKRLVGKALGMFK